MPAGDPLAAVSALDRFDEEQLFGVLGQRLRTISFEPHLSAQFDLSIPPNVESQGMADDFRAFGRRFFSRVNQQAYELVCGSDIEDSTDRKKLAESIALGKESFTAALGTLLVAQLGLAPAVAIVVALLIVRLFFKPTLGAICETWKEKKEKPKE